MKEEKKKLRPAPDSQPTISSFFSKPLIYRMCNIYEERRKKIVCENENVYYCNAIIVGERVTRK
jgi:hypothetical protein